MMYQKCPGTRYLEYAMIGHCVRLKYDNTLVGEYTHETVLSLVAMNKQERSREILRLIDGKPNQCAKRTGLSQIVQAVECGTLYIARGDSA